MTVAGVPPSRGARLVDVGYRPYDGPRRPPSSATGAVYRETLRRSLGIGRSARAKVFPAVALAIAYIPTAVYVGVAVIGRRLERGTPGSGSFTTGLIPTYADNYPQVLLAVLVVAAFVAPEALCPDRRDGTLGLYFSAPLRPGTYLVAKAGAVGTVLAVVTLGPPLVLLVGYTSQGYGPLDAAEWGATLGRIVASGLVVSGLYGLTGLAVAATTTRKGVASVGFLVLVAGSSALVNYLVVEGGADETLALADLAALPYEVVFRIFDETSRLGGAGLSSVSTPAVAAAAGGWALAAAAFLWLRYRRVEVAR